MGENRSLDEFGSVDDPVTPEEDGDDSDDEAVATEVENENGEAVAVDDERESGDSEGSDQGIQGDREDVEPARATYRWDPEGGNCGVCGATADRRWWDETGGDAAGGSDGDADDSSDGDADDSSDQRANASDRADAPGAASGAFVCDDCKQW